VRGRVRWISTARSSLASSVTRTPARSRYPPTSRFGSTRAASRVACQAASDPGGGGTEPDAPRRYEDGGAIGVQLIRGDMSAMGLGTVTRVEGDRLVAFGHPMMEAGVTALPTAIGKVLWFLASDMRSFKIGMPVREVGALVNDRQASIVVSHGAKAPVIPVSMKIRGIQGLPNANWDFEIAHEKFMTPSFVAVALGSALQAMANERQDVSWNATTIVEIRDFGPLKVEDYGVAVGGTPEPSEFGRSNLVRAIGAVMNNPWKPAFIERVSMEMELRYSREILRLRGAEALAPEIDAGQPAKIRLTFQPFSGPEVKRIISVPIPPHLAGQTLTLDIGPGYAEERSGGCLRQVRRDDKRAAPFLTNVRRRRCASGSPDCPWPV